MDANRAERVLVDREQFYYMSHISTVIDEAMKNPEARALILQAVKIVCPNLRLPTIDSLH